MDNSEELLKTIKELEKKIDTLSVPYEEALANRVFEKNQEKFKKWIGVWLAIGALTIGIFGFKSCSDVNEVAEKYVSNQANKMVENRINTEFGKIAANVEGRLDDQLNAEVNKAFVKIDNRIEPIAKRLEQLTADFEASVNPKPIDKNTDDKIQGYVALTYFKKASDNSGQPFAVDDELVAASNVNLRTGNLKNTSDFLNWTITLTIRKGTRVKVLEIVPSGDAQNLAIAKVAVLP